MYHYVVRNYHENNLGKIIGVFDTLKQAYDCVIHLQEEDDVEYYIDTNYIIETWDEINKIKFKII